MQRVELCWWAFQLPWQILQCRAMTLVEQILLVEQVMDLVEFVDGVQDVVGVVGLPAEDQLLVGFQQLPQLLEDPQLGALDVAHNQVLWFGPVQLDLGRLGRSCVLTGKK